MSEFEKNYVLVKNWFSIFMCSIYALFLLWPRNFLGVLKKKVIIMKCM